VRRGETMKQRRNKNTRLVKRLILFDIKAIVCDEYFLLEKEEKNK